MRMRSLEHKNLSRMQVYETEMIQMAHQMFRTLLKYNMYSKERIMELYDRLLYFPPSFTNVPTQSIQRRAFEGMEIEKRKRFSNHIPEANNMWGKSSSRGDV